MTVDCPEQSIPANETGIGKLRIWYHLPFAIYNKLPICGAPNGWDVDADEASGDQLNYFHSYVSDALWKSGERAAQEAAPSIKHFKKTGFEGLRFQAQKTVKSVGSKGHEYPTFEGVIDDVSLRVFRPQGKIDKMNPAMGILVVGVCINRSSIEKAPAASRLQLENAAKLTLSDAQNALDWMRRCFARWVDVDDNNGPFVSGDMVERIRVFGDVAQPRWRTIDGPFKTAPWIKCLMHPWGRQNVDFEFFGDERAYMTSAILLDCEKLDEQDGQSPTERFARQAKLERQAVNSVSEADLFRLAEADPAGTGYPYSRDFVQKRLEGYQYLRHAPQHDSETGNTTRVLIAHHHLCLIGAGGFFDRDVVGFSRSEIGAQNRTEKGGRLMKRGHVDSYYRHLQFLCVYEYFRLILFSQRLTRLVKKRKSDPDFDFPHALQELREDFLEFTHVHHFSNVSHQLQPREMFTQLYKAMELEGRYDEIEAELSSASEFVAAKQTQEAAERAERLNTLISFGVPLSLIAGATGSNLFIGGALGSEAGVALTWQDQVGHLAWISLLISLIWIALSFWGHWQQDKRFWTGVKRVVPWIGVAMCSVLWLYF